MALNTGSYKNNEENLYIILRVELKYNLALACGLLANCEAESSFNTRATGDGNTSYGLFQWHDDRKENLINWCKKKGYDHNSISGQCAFLAYELSNKSDARRWKYDQFLEVSDNRLGAYGAGYYFCKNFERPKDTNSYHRRGIRAQEFYDYYLKNGAAILLKGVVNTGKNLIDIVKEDIENYQSIISSPTVIPITDLYSSEISSNFSRVEASGYDYGYLIDLEHNREFRFYIPEFSESAGSEWGSVDIPGRSVDIKYYQKTNSRSITISLDLFAGEGLYKGKDPVSQLHSDANFIKSLEYPDYSHNSYITPPATVQLILGPVINFTGVVTSVEVSHMKPADSQNRSMYLKVSFTVIQISNNPPDYLNIREGQYQVPNSTDRSDNAVTNVNSGMPSTITSSTPRRNITMDYFKE